VSDNRLIRYAFRGVIFSMVLLFAIVDAATGCEEEDAYSICINTCENNWIDCKSDCELECRIDAVGYKACMQSCTEYLPQN
jgi:hypothetical protein